jgi:hypothetical protein
MIPYFAFVNIKIQPTVNGDGNAFSQLDPVAIFSLNRMLIVACSSH